MIVVSSSDVQKLQARQASDTCISCRLDNMVVVLLGTLLLL